MWTATKLFFAGTGALVVHWGAGALIIAVCLFLALGSQLLGPVISVWLKPLRNDFLWIAAGVAGALCYGTILVKDANAHCTAKTVVIQSIVHDAVGKAQTAPSTKDKWEMK